MEKLKLNMRENKILTQKEMNAIHGGSCGCACDYASSGGSSSADNNAANAAGGLHSPGMVHIWMEMNADGSWSFVDKWI
jgi:natural product precursor